jgi:3-hydroxyisobutyrate dehydrogenase-like beta-hydroxyacid dehydrogenase
MTASLRVGFLGLGAMGLPMAANVAKAGFPLQVWNRTTAKAQTLAKQGVKVGKSPAHVANESDIVITMVARPQDVEQVVLGPEGAAEGIRAGSVLIDMSTVSPMTSRKLAGALAAKHVEFLDAPVVGSKGPAADGTLVILVGGLPQTLARCRPVLQAMGKTIIHAGGVGMGSMLKLSANLMLAHLIAGFSEGIALMQRAGPDPSLFLQLIEASTFHSPWYRMKGTPMLKGDFTTHFALKHMAKDLTLMRQLADELKTPLPVTEAIQRLFVDAEASGKAELDYSAILQHLQQRATPP